MAFYEDNHIPYLRAKFNAELFAHAPEDLKTLIAAVRSKDEIIRVAVEALRYYAYQNHLIQGFENTECYAGEVEIVCTNKLTKSSETFIVEDGSASRTALDKIKQIQKETL